MTSDKIPQADIDRQYRKLNTEAEASGYHLNPDTEFTKELIQGLLVNDDRYGYPSCPCRLAASNKEEDLDIICPCDYRDADVAEFDTCYCGLYVSSAVAEGNKEIGKIPERRPARVEPKKPAESVGPSPLPYPVWRCRVCGYLCARSEPPEVCPICKAKQERFEKFIGVS